MKRIFAVLRRDLTSGLRDFMVVFVLVMPFILALALRLIVPGVGASLFRAAVLEEQRGGVGAWLETCAPVESVRDRAALEARVLRTDDVFGVVEKADGGHEIVRQGNEAGGGEALALLLDARANPDFPSPVAVGVEDVGWKMSPLKLEGGNFLLVFLTVFGGMLIALGMVEEKMGNTLSAVNVSPMRRAEFVAGKATLGFLAPAVSSVGVISILGFEGIDFGMAAVTVLCTAAISVLIGFVIGLASTDPIAAVAGMKTVFLPVFASVFGGIFLSEKWQVLLWWSPHYWSYRTMKSILLNQASWAQVGTSAAIMLGITALGFLALAPKIRRGMK